MRRRRAVRLTRFELEIMNALWGLGGGSVREIREALPERRIRNWRRGELTRPDGAADFI